MKAWHYAAVVIALVVGVVIGLALCGSRKTPTVIAPVVEMSETEKAAREVLSRPSALSLLTDMASAKFAELRMITMRSKTQMIAGSFSVSSEDAERFAVAREDLTLLQQSGLVDPIRSAKDAGRETITYSLTPEGHRVAKMLLAK